MDSTTEQNPGITWAFWAACVLAAAGGIVPLVFGGGLNSRIAGVLVPFVVAAVAMGINAAYRQFGRLLAVVLYFVAGVAMVYGVLGMLAIKLTLLVGGSCDPAPAACPPGFERPLTSAESDSINVVVVLAVLSILAGFFGLMLMYRRRPPFRSTVVATPASEPKAPNRSAHEGPVAAKPPPAVVAATPQTHANSELPDEPKELEAPDEPKELPAHDEPKELPPPA